MHFDGRLPCGCHIKPSFVRQACGPHELTQCPLHANAGSLLSVCKLLVLYHEYDHPTNTVKPVRVLALERAKKIIASAEGKPEKETIDA